MATAFAFSIRGRSGQLLRSGAQGPSRDSKGHSFARYGARFHGDEIGISGSASQSDCQPGIGEPDPQRVLAERRARLQDANVLDQAGRQ